MQQTTWQIAIVAGLAMMISSTVASEQIPDATCSGYVIVEKYKSCEHETNTPIFLNERHVECGIEESIYWRDISCGVKVEEKCREAINIIKTKREVNVGNARNQRHLGNARLKNARDQGWDRGRAVCNELRENSVRSGRFQRLRAEDGSVIWNFGDGNWKKSPKWSGSMPIRHRHIVRCTMKGWTPVEIERQTVCTPREFNRCLKENKYRICSKFTNEKNPVCGSDIISLDEITGLHLRGFHDISIAMSPDIVTCSSCDTLALLAKGPQAVSECAKTVVRQISTSSNRLSLEPLIKGLDSAAASIQPDHLSKDLASALGTLDELNEPRVVSAWISGLSAQVQAQLALEVLLNSPTLISRLEDATLSQLLSAKVSSNLLRNRSERNQLRDWLLTQNERGGSKSLMVADFWARSALSNVVRLEREQVEIEKILAAVQSSTSASEVEQSVAQIAELETVSEPVKQRIQHQSRLVAQSLEAVKVSLVETVQAAISASEIHVEATKDQYSRDMNRLIQHFSSDGAYGLLGVYEASLQLSGPLVFSLVEERINQAIRSHAQAGVKYSMKNIKTLLEERLLGQAKLSERLSSEIIHASNASIDLASIVSELANESAMGEQKFDLAPFILRKAIKSIQNDRRSSLDALIQINAIINDFYFVPMQENYKKAIQILDSHV